jgi:hypothetical protein
MKQYQGRISGTVHIQWFLYGEWTSEEIASIEAYFQTIMTPQSLYFWIIYKFSTGFEAKKIHWDRFVPKGKTVELLEQEMRKCCTWEEA